MIEYPLDLPLRIEFPVRKMFYSRKACITFRRQERKVNTGQIRKPDYITIRCFVIAWRIIIYIGFYGVPFQRFLSLSLFIATQILNVQHCKNRKPHFRDLLLRNASSTIAVALNITTTIFFFYFFHVCGIKKVFLDNKDKLFCF